MSLGLGLTLLVDACRDRVEHRCRNRHQRPARSAPALFLVDIPREQARGLTALTGARLPGAELRLVPSLRGPVTAVNGTRVTDLKAIPEGAWILRGDRGLTFARDLPPANRIVAGEWWPEDYRGPPLVSIDVDAATALGLKVGDSLTIGVLGRPIEARIASLRARSTGAAWASISRSSSRRGRSKRRLIR